MHDNTPSMAQTSSTSKIRTKWSELGVSVYVKILIIAILFYCLFHNEIYSIVHKWVTNSSWSHGFIIPLFSLYFLNQTKKDVLNLHARPNYLGLFLPIRLVTSQRLGQANGPRPPEAATAIFKVMGRPVRATIP